YDPTPAAPEPAPQAESNRIMPMMSAAETLASYDPFADESEADASAFLDVAPVAAFEPNVEPAEQAAPAAIAEPEQLPAHRPLAALFADTPVTARTEAAAETLATAFGRAEPQGRPTRAASSELSLDRVFRGAPESAPHNDGGFSFDQFFSDSTRPTGDVATA